MQKELYISNENLLSLLLPYAEQGEAEAQYNVGMLLNNGGYGIKKDWVQAFEWFKKSAAQGHPLAAYKLGCYYAGQAPEAVHQDSEKALHYKTVAADAGYALAQWEMGVHYSMQEDYKKALYWHKKAAKQKDIQALYNVAGLYGHGVGAEKSEAMELAYIMLAEQAAKQHGDDALARKYADIVQRADKERSEEVRAAAKAFVAQWQWEITPVTYHAQNGIRKAFSYVQEHYTAEQVKARIQE